MQRVGGGDSFSVQPGLVMQKDAGSGHDAELVVVQEGDSTTAYQAAEGDALSCTRIQAGAATTAVRDSISSHIMMYHLAMGIRNYLIEGVSGTGKSSVWKELERRGYYAINGDRELAYQGDPGNW